MPATSPPRSPWVRLRTWWAECPPAAAAAVLATGILSVGLHEAGDEVLSRIALVLAAVIWLGFAVDFTVRLLRDRERWLEEAGTPSALTGVAATAVLGTRLTDLGWLGAAEVLLALAAVLWPGLLYLFVRGLRLRMPGSVFLGCVATQALAVLAASLAEAARADWLAYAALVLFWLGFLVLYVVALTCFDLRETATGGGDQWIAGGALAISALAASKLVLAYQADGYLWNYDDNGVMLWVSQALIMVTLAWYAVLAVAELLWRRPRYDVRRWATVFPMAMTAAAALSVADAVGFAWLRGLGQVLLWTSVAAWLLVAAGTVRSTAPR
ncbi:tellurite resistance/C4-dicarboxylate transporter family protein [Streptomyces sp. NPDC057950]|uniref:tellurite resistance/C4-dicarboxylate transporter family protein n=1 Tax=Streptomyces sp. NPDC057950 TaxID=3346288 RepID=UPI0036E0A230